MAESNILAVYSKLFMISANEFLSAPRLRSLNCVLRASIRRSVDTDLEISSIRVPISELRVYWNFYVVEVFLVS
jgi:hypothetical protein